MEAIKTKNLTKSYGSKNVVDNINLCVPEGSIYGFIGLNGAGKSTTQKMVSGLAIPTSGEVLLFGKPVSDSEIRKNIGALIEVPGIYGNLSTFTNAVLQACNIGLDKPKEKAAEVLEKVGLGSFKNRKAKHLSLGMKQRLGIAVALLNNPRLLVLDEPINGLDPEGIVELRVLFEKINKEDGVTIFISSHILGELSKIATHYGIIKDGKLIEQMSAEDFVNKKDGYLRVRVDNTDKARLLIEETFDQSKVEKMSDQILHCFGVDDSRAVNKLLAKNDVDVYELYYHERNLEDYFLHIMEENDND